MPSVAIKPLAKPILKWAGGKGQLLNLLDQFLPHELPRGKIKRYVEPFVGGGALFFHLAQHYKIDEFYLSDINHELMMLYQVVQSDVEQLIDMLQQFAGEYSLLNDIEQQDYFLNIRQLYNKQRLEIVFDSFS